MTYRKVGGLHFVRMGRVCFSFCLTRRRPVTAADRYMARTMWARAFIASLEG